MSDLLPNLGDIFSICPPPHPPTRRSMSKSIFFTFLLVCIASYFYSVQLCTSTQAHYCPREAELCTFATAFARSLPGREREEDNVFFDKYEQASHARTFSPNMLPPLFTQHTNYWIPEERHLLGQEHIWSLDIPRSVDLSGQKQSGMLLLAGNAQTVSLVCALDAVIMAGVNFSIDISPSSAPLSRNLARHDIIAESAVYSVPPHPHTSHMYTMRHSFPGLKRGGRGEYDMVYHSCALAPCDMPNVVQNDILGEPDPTIDDTIAATALPLISQCGKACATSASVHFFLHIAFPFFL